MNFSFLLELLAGSSSVKYLSGATYRVNDDWPDGSCQFRDIMDYRTNPYVVGVGSWWWKHSLACGQCILIENGNRRSWGIVADYCPECTPRQLDVSPQISRQLSPTGITQNYPTLNVSLAQCRYIPSHPLRYQFYDGSSDWVWYLGVQYTSEPILALKINDQPAQHDGYGRWVVRGKRGQNRITLRNNHTSVNDTIDWQPGTREVWSKISF